MYVGWSVWANRTFLFVDQSSPNFFRPTRKELWLLKFFSDVRYVDPFRRYLRSKSKVVKNRAEIWTFFWPSLIWGGFQKLYARYHPCVAARCLEKFREDTPTSPEVIEAHALNFKANFKFLQLKFFGGPQSQLGCALGCLRQSLVC